MSDQIIQYTEEMVGANHPTKADTLNRALLVGHNADGTHKEAFGLSRLQQLIDNLSIAATVGSKALTVAVKGEDGNNCSASNVHTIGFRSATLTDGKPVPRTLQAASSIVLPSGATLGFTANEAGRIYVWEIDNAGTVEPALSRTADIFPESNLVSTTAIGADSDSASVMYSTTARTNVACRCVGYIEITTGATAGEWDNNPTKIQNMGPGVKRTGIVSGTTVAASGTYVDFTSIPLETKRITIMFAGVSTNGASDYLIQLGDSGGVENSGYLGSCVLLVHTGTVVAANYTAGIPITNYDIQGAANVMHGSVILELLDALTNTWVARAVVGFSNAPLGCVSGSSKSLSATLDRVRITTENGSDAFDAGSINILCE